jgi:hypothetical protein
MCYEFAISQVEEDEKLSIRRKFPLNIKGTQARNYDYVEMNGLTWA